MSTEEPTITISQCTEEVRLMARRAALLYHAFASALVEELGDEQGKRLIEKAIRAYGHACGQAIKDDLLAQGLPLTPENFNRIRDLPAFGWEKAAPEDLPAPSSEGVLNSPSQGILSLSKDDLPAPSSEGVLNSPSQGILSLSKDVESQGHSVVTYCPLAAVWMQMGAPAARLGRLYCFVDQAKQEAYNPDYEFLHLKNVLDGDPYCVFALRQRADT